MSTPSSSKTNWAKVALGTAATLATGYAAYRFFTQRKAAGCCANKNKAAVMPADAIDSFPIVDLADFMSNDPSKKSKIDADCKQIAECLYKYGILIIRDPRVQESQNQEFLDLLERYYEQPAEAREADVRAQWSYQVGTTPSGIEKARNHCSTVEKLGANEKPMTACPPEFDPKSRFFWRMGEQPKETEFASLNMPPVIPKAFPEWSSTMNSWGTAMLDAVHTVSEMAAIGLDLPPTAFTDRMKLAPHLLAPTASDFKNNGKLGTVFASFHYDLNFLTIHGRSRFPGLFIWTREGKKVMVKVPERCLLLQAGKQFEWLTGGHVLAGFHEVVVVPETLKAVEKAKAEGRSLWRISSTLFSHMASDTVLEPLGHFKTAESAAKYPPTKTGKQVQEELAAIKLAGLNGMV